MSFQHDNHLFNMTVPCLQDNVPCRQGTVPVYRDSGLSTGPPHVNTALHVNMTLSVNRTSHVNMTNRPHWHFVNRPNWHFEMACILLMASPESSAFNHRYGAILSTAASGHHRARRCQQTPTHSRIAYRLRLSCSEGPATAFCNPMAS